MEENVNLNNDNIGSLEKKQWIEPKLGIIQINNSGIGGGDGSISTGVGS